MRVHLGTGPLRTALIRAFIPYAHPRTKAESVQVLADLLDGGETPEDYRLLGGAIRAANFFDAAKVLDPLLKHVGAIAATAAAAPPPNPYAVMFGMDDAESLPNQIRALIQDIRSTEPALADRITRAVCGGDAVTGATAAAAYTNATGNAYLKSIAAKMAGGTLVLSSDGTAESVNGIAVEFLATASEIEKEFESDAPPIKGVVDSVLSFESDVTKEEACANDGRHEGLEDYGAPAMKTVTVEVGCTLAVAAGAARCQATVTLRTKDPEWNLPGVAYEHGIINGVVDFCREQGFDPSLDFEVEVTDGTVSGSEMAALCSPDGFEDALVDMFRNSDEGNVSSEIFDNYIDDDGVKHHNQCEPEYLNKHPLFVLLVRPLMDSMWP